MKAKENTISFTLNGKSTGALAGETILDTARRAGISIPHLCAKKGYRPDGNCRACVVEIKGERVLAPSCCRYPTPGMEVTTDSPRSRQAQKLVLELLMSDMPGQGKSPYTHRSRLDIWADKLNLAIYGPINSTLPRPAFQVELNLKATYPTPPSA